MRKYQWDIYAPSGILGQKKNMNLRNVWLRKFCLFSVAECVLYVLFSRKLLKMSSNRFYRAEEVAAILAADILWHENGSDISDYLSSEWIHHLIPESYREEFDINEPILTAQGIDQNDQLFESAIESEQEAVVIEEHSTSEADNNTAKGNPSVDTNESNESIAQNVT